MRSRTSAALLASAVLFSAAPAWSATAPPLATIDANFRAEGNRREVARSIGDKLFVTRWPAQIVKVGADGIGNHIVVGLLISGVKFHHPLTRAQFAAEVASVAAAAFSVTPYVAEVDVWATVPLKVPRGEDVSGDLAMPTTRTVFSATVSRGEPASTLRKHLLVSRDVYWDEEWTRTLFKERT